MGHNFFKIIIKALIENNTPHDSIFILRDRGFWTNAKFTNAVPNFAILSLHTCKGFYCVSWVFRLVPLTRIFCNAVFFKSQNPRNVCVGCFLSIKNEFNWQKLSCTKFWLVIWQFWYLAVILVSGEALRCCLATILHKKNLSRYQVNDVHIVHNYILAIKYLKIFNLSLQKNISTAFTVGGHSITTWTVLLWTHCITLQFGMARINRSEILHYRKYSFVA